MTVVSVSTVRPPLTRGQRLWLFILRLLALIPWLWLAGFAALMVATLLQTGLVPPGDVPDPRTLDPWGVVVTPLLILLILAIAAPLLMFLVALLARRSLPGPRYRPTLTFFVAGEAVILLLLSGAIFFQEPLQIDLQEAAALALFGVPLLGVIALAAWADIVTYRWTRWAIAAVLWGVAFGALAPQAPALLTWLIN